MRAVNREKQRKSRVSLGSGVLSKLNDDFIIETAMRPKRYAQLANIQNRTMPSRSRDLTGYRGW